MERFEPENYIYSTEKVDDGWQEERRRDLEFTHAFLDLAEKFPQLQRSIPLMLHALHTYRRDRPNKDLSSQQPGQPKK